MSLIAFIPARAGSKSIAKKNIKYFCGKPLIFWVSSQGPHSKRAVLAFSKEQAQASILALVWLASKVSRVA